jgi:general secretion pathway protein G
LNKTRRKSRSVGFTLIELMIVITILLVLMAVAVPKYEHSVTVAKEAVLRQDLFTLRRAIDQYTEDKQRAPQALDDLVSDGYLKALPKDPFTNATDTWLAEQSDDYSSVDQQEPPGITDVHSGAGQVGSDGTAYNTW